MRFFQVSKGFITLGEGARDLPDEVIVKMQRMLRSRLDGFMFLYIQMVKCLVDKDQDALNRVVDSSISTKSGVLCGGGTPMFEALEPLVGAGIKRPTGDFAWEAKAWELFGQHFASGVVPDRGKIMSSTPLDIWIYRRHFTKTYNEARLEEGAALFSTATPMTSGTEGAGGAAVEDGDCVFTKP